MLGKVPPALYLAADQAPEDSVPVAVGRAGCVLHRVDVPHAGDAITWDFRTDSCDIGFGLFAAPAGSAAAAAAITAPTRENLTELLPVTRVDSHVCPEAGSFVATHAGPHYLCFDNTYSWTRSKTVLLSLQVLPAALPSADADRGDVAHGMAGLAVV